MSKKLLSLLLIVLVIASFSISYVIFSNKLKANSKTSNLEAATKTSDTNKEVTPSSPSNSSTSSNTNLNNNTNTTTNNTGTNSNATSNNSNTNNTGVNTGTSANGPLTKDAAESIAAKIAKTKFQSVSISYDRDNSQNGKNYYVFRIYNNMNDHIATLAWYYVDKSNGSLYELDIVSNELKPVTS